MTSPAINPPSLLRWKLLLGALLSLPAVVLLYAAIANTLGPDPAEKLADETGEWALRLLLLTLAVSPLRRLTGRAALLRFRRMLGLFTFFYASLHLLVYLLFLLGLDFSLLLQEVAERPYITVGFAAFVLMLPLAITSTRGWQRRLGWRWKRLHTLVYPAVLLAVWHLWWQQRSDIGEALFYLAITIVLLGARLLLARSRA